MAPGIDQLLHDIEQIDPRFGLSFEQLKPYRKRAADHPHALFPLDTSSGADDLCVTCDKDDVDCVSDDDWVSCSKNNADW